MNSARGMMSQRSTVLPPASNRRLAWLGTGALVAGVIILILQGVESAQGIPGMPRFWHQNQTLWLAFGMVGLIVGVQFLWRAESRLPQSLEWRPTRGGRRFRQLVLYTRAGCHLCEDAAELLAGYSHWLPLAREVDIDQDPKLVEQFGTCVPVVVCDEKVRFRSRVDETLLRRLIEGTPPIDWP